MYKSKSYQINEFLYYTSLTLYLIGRCFEYTVWANEIILLLSVVKNVAYILLVPCLLVATHSLLISKGKYLRVNGLGIVLIIIYLAIYIIVFKVNAGFVCFGYALAAIKIDRTKLFRFLKVIFIALLSCIMIGGLFNNNINIRSFGNTRERYAFGFNDAYSLQMLWMSIVTCLIITKRRKNRTYLFSMLLVTLFFQLLGDTRTAFLTTVFLIVFDYLLEKKILNINFQNRNRKRFFVLRHVFIVCFATINALCWLHYKSPNVVTLLLDGVFTGRISMTDRFITYICNGTVPIFPIIGDSFDLSSAALSSLALDSDYSQMLFGYGLLYSLVVLFVLDKFSSRTVKKGEVRIVAIIAAIALNGMLQSTVISILYNPIILLSVEMIIEKDAYS